MAKNKKNDIDSFSGMFNGTAEQIAGQETIETLEGGKYMPEPPKAEEKGKQTAKEPKAQKTDRKRGRPEEDRETKKRVSLAVLPSLYENVGKIAYVDRTSISEIASQLFEQYVAENMDKIREYDRIKK